MSIKALTIQQPYAHYIIHGDESGDRKDVENRTWPTKYRGPLLIHAGVGRDYVRRGGKTVRPEWVFGAIVGIVEVTECFGLLARMGVTMYRQAVLAKPHDLRWAEGPWCWRLADPRPLAEPVPCKGKLGLWAPDAETMRAVMEQLGT